MGEVTAVFTTGQQTNSFNRNAQRNKKLSQGTSGYGMGLRPRGFEPHSPKAASPDEVAVSFTTGMKLGEQSASVFVDVESK